MSELIKRLKNSQTVDILTKDFFFIGLIIITLDQVILSDAFRNTIYLILIYSLYSFTLICGAWQFYLYKSRLEKQTQYISQNETKRNPRKEITWLLILIAVFLLLTIPRLNFILVGDEYFQFNTASGLIKTGKLVGWNFITEQPFMEYGRSWITTIFFSLPMRLFGINPLFARLASLIAGVFLIPATYYFVNFFLKNKHISLLTTFFVITNTWYIYYATNIRMYIFLQLAILAFLFTAYQGYNLNTKGLRPINIVMAGIIWWIGSQIHYIMVPLLITVLVYYIITFCKKNILFFTTYKKFSILLIVTLITAIGILLSSKNTLQSIVEITAPGIKAYFDTNFTFTLNNLSAISFFTFNFVIASILIISNLFANYRQAGFNYLFINFVVLHLAYIFLIDKQTLSYISTAFILNISLLLYAIYTTGKLLKLSQKSIIISLFILILVFNFNFAFAKEIKNGKKIYPNNYNLDVIYKEFSKKSQRPNYKIAIEKLQQYYTSTNTIVLGYQIPNVSYYYQDIFDKRTNYYELKKYKSFYNVTDINNKDYTINDIIQTKRQYKHGIIIWPERKNWHIDEQLRQYVETEFKKISGPGIDDSRIEIYIW